MKSFKMFMIVLLLILIISASPLHLDETVNRLSDLGMHPHIHQNSHASHKKVKRTVNFKVNDAEFTNSYWIDNAMKTVEMKLQQQINAKKAKNVIFFLGDGLSHTSLAAARVQQGDESSKLSFEYFPFTASSKTYCVDRAVADSACSGTAFLHGVKTNAGVIGMNAKTQRGNCNNTNNEDLYTSSIASWFLKDGRNAGIVTTTKITDATPAVMYAHIAERNWEGNQQVEQSGCGHNDIKDIADQLIHGSVGPKLKVILGGGSKNFINSTEIEHGINGSRTDGKNLIKEWIGFNSNNYFVRNRKELMDINPSKTNKIFGLFHADHMPYNLETISKNEQKLYPTLTEMTMKAIDVLSQDDKGYFLMVEGGRIDHGHHENQARLAIEEVLEFSKSIQIVTENVDLDETLIVVTADHSHVMTIAGYSSRGTDIFSAPNKGNDGIPYYTISYSNGPGFMAHTNNGKRLEFQKSNTSPINFRFPSAVPLNFETHAGEDVGIWAIGPNAHIFKGTIEQNLIAHIMAYASCVGDTLKACD